MITLVYTSRYQHNVLPLPYMHYTVNLFTVKDFRDDKSFEESSLIDDWIDNIHKKYAIVPRKLLFQKNPQYGVTVQPLDIEPHILDQNETVEQGGMTSTDRESFTACNIFVA
jgi:hypothetical protein